MDTGYLYYYLRSPIGQGKLKERQTGTTVTGIKQAEFRKIEIELPDIKTQRVISSVLEAIDDKLTNNRQINENLAQQAQAIYADMFITNGDPAWPMGHLADLITVKYGNSALFVSLRAPHERIQIGGIEHRLREMGKRLNIPKVHPHKFRRTLATIAIDKGMPIEQLQRLLGHQRIDTTLQYAMVKQRNVKTAHRKYIG